MRATRVSGPSPPRAARWALLAVPLAFLALFFVWPLGALVWRALADAGLAVDASTLTLERTWRVIGTTFGLAAIGTFFALLVGLPAAWALFTMRWKGQRVVRALLSVPFALPTVVVAAAFSSLLRPSGSLGFLGADQTLAAIGIALAFFNVPVVLRVVGGGWASLDHGTAVAARSLGANRWQAFRHVTLPALTPALVSAAAIVFLFCATSFGIVLILGGTRVSTVETEIWLQVNQFLDLRAAAVLAVIQVAIVAATLGVAAWARARRERHLRRLTEASDRRAVGGDRPFVIVALVPAAALFLLPMSALLERSLRTSAGWGVDHYLALAVAPNESALSSPVWEAALNSLEAAAIATAIAVALGLILAHGLTHTRRPAWIDGLAMLPLGVSAVVIGLGVLLTLNRPLPGGLDLGDPRILIPAAQAVIALPLVVRSLTPSLRSVDPALRSAAASLGAGPWRIWREVDWPAVRRPLALASGLAAAVSLGEFGATSFLARPDHPTLPTAIFRLLSRPGLENVGMAFAASVVLALVTGGVMLTAERWRKIERSEL